MAKLPSGPKSTKYGVNENGRAVVFFDGDTFQFTKKDTDDKYVLISGTGPFLLDDLSEEKETKVD